LNVVASDIDHYRLTLYTKKQVSFALACFLFDKTLISKELH